MGKNKFVPIPEPSRLGLFLLRLFLLMLAAVFCLIGPVAAQETPAPSADAIAVRVVPNPNHYSISRWYESQGFNGSPQSLTVDGYEAIRDGRTVYVNAANVDTAGKKIYSNIYLISYNQNPEPKTVDILGQIIAHWQFNTNLGQIGACDISSSRCQTAADCVSGQVCAANDLAAGTCQLVTPVKCLLDSDCPVNFFCTSSKAKITRDLERLGQLEELKEALFGFKNINGHYPLLTSGSYIPGYSLSVWPSWLGTFLPNLAAARIFSDPINRLGPCPDFDPGTCWNEDTKRFWQPPSLPADAPRIVLPGGSYAFVYNTDANGSDYSLCAVLESRYPPLDYNFSSFNPVSFNCATGGVVTGGGSGNTAPYLSGVSLTGSAGQEYNGFVKAADAEGNPLTWVLETADTTWTGWKNNDAEGQAPVLMATNDPNQKKIYAQRAGAPGNYLIGLTISDGQGGTLATTTSLVITNPTPFIEAADGEYVLDPTVPFGYSFSFSGSNIDEPDKAYSVEMLSGPFDLLALKTAIEITVSTVGINKYQVTYSGVIPTSHQFTADTDFVYKVTVTNKLKGSSTKTFTLHIRVDRPYLDFNCPPAIRLSLNYRCSLGPVQSGHHTLTYSNLAALPADLYLIAPGSPTSTEPVYLQGQATVISTGTLINIKVTNEYGPFSTRGFTLRVNDYCGDGQKQTPNLEGRGGIYNDGYEDCDGNAGVTLDPAASSPEKQYGCQPALGETTPEPILSNNYCVFKSPLAGGGFCGDGYCQLEIETPAGPVDVENPTNCPMDCSPDAVSPTCDSSIHQHLSGMKCVCDNGWYDCDADPANGCESQAPCVGCTPNCQAGWECGDDDCGGTCGTCAPGKTCENHKCVCTPDCADRQCGPDGCGDTCGTCAPDETCNQAGQCVCEIICGEDCCNSNTQICCGDQCKPKNLYSLCGNACCHNSKEVCCDNVCRSKSEYTACGISCCTKQQTCDKQHHCVNK